MALAIPNGLDNSSERPGERAPLVLGETTYHDITESVCRVAERPPSAGWVGGFLFSFALLQMLGLLILYLIYTGVGVWGNRSPIFWGWPIVNFVFWVGIGHAGTLISAILFLFRQEWRTSINRAAEAMTIFAVACAGTFPGIHVGRAWLAFWLAPYPSLNLWMWPQFR
ncbi:MAG: hydrogenase, partial [Planctomycetota bacterium]